MDLCLPKALWKKGSGGVQAAKVEKSADSARTRTFQHTTSTPLDSSDCVVFVASAAAVAAEARGDKAAGVVSSSSSMASSCADCAATGLDADPLDAACGLRSRLARDVWRTTAACWLPAAPGPMAVLVQMRAVPS